ncbi:MAG: zinc-binding alcohol dehydrogenase [Ardenticatenaceae bacterium]|nr:zinc-binding alcohol dehydrogenase [Ardenticatenaceae bacterium]
MPRIRENHFLQFLGDRKVGVESEPLPEPGRGQVRLATAASAVSAGTELLVYRGQLPADMAVDDTIEALAEQQNQYPLRYGYAAVGTVEKIGPQIDEAWLGSRVFAFAPHSGRPIVPVEQLILLPDDIAIEDALFLPNMETAVSFVMDGRPVIGEEVLVIGQGIVGLLTTMILADLPLANLTVVDYFAQRQEMAQTLGATNAFHPDELQSMDADLTYELSGNPAALDLAVAQTGFAGRIVIGSWYGTKRAPIDLGSHFHRSHMTLISSQVSHLHPRWSGRWSKARRLAVAWEMILRHRPGRLITHRFPLRQAAKLYELIDQRPGEALQTIFTYDSSALRGF